MEKTIKVKTVGKNFAESSGVILYETPDTILVFRPELHGGGVRGYLVRYKKGRTENWSDLNENNFTKIHLEAKTKIEIELKTNAIKKLQQSIYENQKIVNQGIKYGETEYVVAEKNKVIYVDDKNKFQVFHKILEKEYTDDFWRLLTESEPELATRLSIGHILSGKQKVLDELRERLTRKYPETEGPSSWQQWIYLNNWLFGLNYLKAIQKNKINISGIIPDYIFISPDNFIDVLEIKLPEEDVIVEDKNHPGTYKWSSKANEAIGQIVNYLGEIDRLQGELKREIKRVYRLDVSFVKPRGFILIGQKDGWDEFKKEALRKLNFAMHGVEVLTYTDLLYRGEELIQMYKNKEEVED